MVLNKRELEYKGIILFKVIPGIIGATTQGKLSTIDRRELEYRIPRLHSPANSRRLPETFEDFSKNKTTLL